MNSDWFLTLFLCAGICLSASASDDSGIIDTPNVGRLRVEIASNNVALIWPSDSRESFVVLWRSNLTVESPWIVLTNQMPAPAVANETTFFDANGLSRSPIMATNADVEDFYRVLIIPDFWFNMGGVVLNGGPKNPGEDFLPFYFGSSETGFLQPEVGLFVDGEDQSIGAGSDLGTDVERVNFGTSKKPRWIYASGLWFRHDRLTNGAHTFELRSQFTLNNFIGQWTQTLTVTNRPVRVWITNDISYVGFPPFVGKSNLTIVAQSAEPRVNWRIDIYDKDGNWLVSKRGRTATGDIHWTWNLRDAHGQLHDDPDKDFTFFPLIACWSWNDSQKGSQLLMQRQTHRVWWNRILGNFIRDDQFPYLVKQAVEQDEQSLTNKPLSRPMDLLSAKNDPSVSPMTLEFDGANRFITITPDYSNAVLAALLPYFSDFASRLNLVSHPLTENDVTDCRILPWHNKNGEIPNTSITTKENLWFSFEYGHVNDFSRLQNPHEAQKHSGKIKLSSDEAIKLAENTIKRLRIPLEDVFAEQKSDITLQKDSNNYLVQWFDPRGSGPAPTRIEINVETGQVESLLLHNKNLEKQSPIVKIVPPAGHGMFDSQLPPPMNPDYAWKLIPIMFKAVDEYAQKLSLPIPRPLTTNNVAKIEAYNNEGWPHCEIWLTNGWRFIYRHTMVNGYYSPDNFFDSDDRKIHIKDFEGKWNLTTNQAIEIVRQAVAKLDYPTNHIHIEDAKTFIHGASLNAEHIPRLSFEWYYEPNDDLQSRLEAEVNMENGKLESLYYDDKAYWNSRPPIDVPISNGKYPANPR